MLSLGGLASKLFGSSNERRIKGFRPKVQAINALEADIEKLSSINNKDLQTSIAEPGVPDLTPSFAGFD